MRRSVVISVIASLSVAFTISLIVIVKLLNERIVSNPSDRGDVSDSTELRRLQSLLWSAYAERQFAEGDTQTALALAIEADRTYSNPKSQQVLEMTAYPPGVQRLLSQRDANHILRSAILSPDGQTIVVGENSGRLTLRNMITGNVIQEFVGHNQRISTVDFSSNEKYIISGDDGGKVIVWDATFGKIVHELPVSVNMSVASVMFSPDSQSFLTAVDTQLIIWGTSTGIEIQQTQALAPYNVLHQVKFSPDGKLIAMVGQGGYAIIWDIATNETRQLNGHGDTNTVNVVNFSPDGKRLVTAASTDLFLWDVVTGQQIGPFYSTYSPNQFSFAAFSPDGRQIVSTGRESQLLIWDVETRQVVQRLGGFFWNDAYAMFLKDGEHIVSWHDLNQLIVWDLQDGQLVWGHPSIGISFTQITISPDGKLAAFATQQGEVWLWDIVNDQFKQSLIGHQSGRLVKTVDFSPVGTTLLSTGDTGDMILWDVLTGQELRRFNGLNVGPTNANFSPDGKFIVSSTLNAQLVLWDVASGEQIRSFTNGHTGAIYSANFSPDGNEIVSAGDNGEVILWDVNTGQEIRRFEGHDPSLQVLNAEFSPDGRIVASGDFENKLILQDAESGKTIDKINGATFQFSADGNYILTVNNQTAIPTLWSLETVQIVRHFDRYSARTGGIAFTPDGKNLLAAGAYGQLYFWRVHLSEEFDQWIQENRYVPELTCQQRIMYSVTPLCETESSTQ